MNGRPSKLNDEVLKAFKDVLADNQALYLTDEELFHLINERLDEDNTFCYTTFKNWKRGNLELGKLESDNYKQFLSLLKNALIKEKVRLLKKLEDGDNGNWTRFAWILERKFDDWNLRKKIDSKSELNVNRPIQIEVINPLSDDSN
jgi:hypothetical protein